MSYLSNDQCTEKRVSRDILYIIDKICFSDEYKDFRMSRGFNGQINLIIQSIENKYEV